MQKISSPRVLSRRAIVSGFGLLGLTSLLSACGGGTDNVFATNAARNAASGATAPAAGGATAPSASSAAGTPAATTATGSAVATAGTGSASPAVAAGTTAAGTVTGPTPTHITGAGTLPKPLPTQGGGAPTVVGAPTRAAASGVASPAATSPAASTTPQPAAKVTITANRAFDPSQLSINKGEAIQWVNAGRSPQTVTDDPARAADKKNAVLPTGAQPWDSGVVGSGGQYTKVFDVPGDYVYFSIPAEGQGLIGRITVKG